MNILPCNTENDCEDNTEEYDKLKDSFKNKNSGPHWLCRIFHILFRVVRITLF
jgi:hypothetical protein